MTERIIRCAIEVHRVMGPGLLERPYHAAMEIELTDSAVHFVSGVRIPAVYKRRFVGEYYVDFIVENLVIVEIKSVERMLPVFDAQIITYLKLQKLRVGLLLNFNSRIMKEGIKRLIV